VSKPTTAGEIDAATAQALGLSVDQLLDLEVEIHAAIREAATWGEGLPIDEDTLEVLGDLSTGRIVRCVADAMLATTPRASDGK